MPDKKEIKKLERRAKFLLVSKEILPEKMKIVRSLLNSGSLEQEEKFTAVIDLLLHCEDKKEPSQLKKPLMKKVQVEDLLSDRAVFFSGPTETSLYIDEIHKKYRRFGFFKKRRLAYKNNRIGLGFRKRLVPSKT